jgi:hypothetical protein
VRLGSTPSKPFGKKEKFVNLDIHPKSPNRRDKLSVKAQRAQHLRIDISVMSLKSDRANATPLQIINL